MVEVFKKVSGEELAKSTGGAQSYFYNLTHYELTALTKAKLVCERTPSGLHLVKKLIPKSKDVFEHVHPSEIEKAIEKFRKKDKDGGWAGSGYSHFDCRT